MDIERKISKWGETSAVFVIPPDLLKHLGINVGDTVIIRDETGKHGVFASFWKKAEKTEE